MKALTPGGVHFILRTEVAFAEGQPYAEARVEVMDGPRRGAVRMWVRDGNRAASTKLRLTTLEARILGQQLLAAAEAASGS